jgi:hypothetical protein
MERQPQGQIARSAQIGLVERDSASHELRAGEGSISGLF